MARIRLVLPVWLVCLLLGAFGAADAPPRPQRPSSPLPAVDALDQATKDAHARLLDRYVADDATVLVDLRNFWAPFYSEHVFTLNRARLLVQATPEARVALAAIAQTDLALNAFNFSAALGNKDLSVAELFINRLLPRAQSSQAERQFMREWYYAIIWLHMGRGDEAEARAALQRAGELFPDDPELLLSAGTVDELSASFLRFDPRLKRAGNQATAAVIERNHHIVNAIASFRQAIAHDPSAVEARIHLALLLSAEGERAREEALTLLREASALAANPTLKYLAGLFAGDIEEKRGDLAAASLSYRTAIAACPRAQTARLALSHLQLNQYDDERPAQNTLRPLTAGPPKADGVCEPDPWLIYKFGQAWRFAALMQQLRAQVRAAPVTTEARP